MHTIFCCNCKHIFPCFMLTEVVYRLSSSLHELLRANSNELNILYFKPKWKHKQDLNKDTHSNFPVALTFAEKNDPLFLCFLDCKRSGICNSSSRELEAGGQGQTHLCRETSCTRWEHGKLEIGFKQSSIHFFLSFPLKGFSATASWFCCGRNGTQNLDMLGKFFALHLQTLNSLLWGSLVVYIFFRTIIDSTVLQFLWFQILDITGIVQFQ